VARHRRNQISAFWGQSASLAVKFSAVFLSSLFCTNCRNTILATLKHGSDTVNAHAPYRQARTRRLVRAKLFGVEGEVRFGRVDTTCACRWWRVVMCAIVRSRFFCRAAPRESSTPGAAHGMRDAVHRLICYVRLKPLSNHLEASAEQ